MKKIETNKDFIFLKNKKILITGNTGFKGVWLSKVLSIFSNNIYGISIDIPTKPSLYDLINIKKELRKQFFFDISDYSKLSKTIKKINPDIIFHMAAQPLVIEGYKNPYNTYITNTVGTLNILEILRKSKKKIPTIIITTDKVYDNSKPKSYKENDLLGAEDPYGNSKVSAELIVRTYVQSYFNKKKCFVAVARSGNVIGGGDYSFDRLIPDFFRSNNVYLRNPNQIRPWQHVIDPTVGYINLVKYILENKMNYKNYSWNFGPKKKNFVRVKYIINFLKKKFPKKKIYIKKKKYKETNVLKLNSEKSKKYLNWSQKLSIEDTLNYISDYYRTNSKIKDVVNKQIFEYFNK